MHFGKCVGISGTIPQTIAGLTRVDYIDLESTKAYHPQPAPLPIGLLEKMVAAIGLARSQVFISNVIPWRPPANRTPSPIETAACEVFVRQEIRLVRPKVLVPSYVKTMAEPNRSLTFKSDWKQRPRSISTTKI